MNAGQILSIVVLNCNLRNFKKLKSTFDSERGKTDQKEIRINFLGFWNLLQPVRIHRQ